VSVGPMAKDLDRYFQACLGDAGSAMARARLIVLDSDLHCVLAYRFGRNADRLYARNKVLGVLPVVIHRVWNRWVTHHHHTDISRGAEIGPGFLLMHRNGVFIGPVVIGRNCVVHHHVTLGERVAGGDHSVPRLGNNVWIGPGAIVYGGVSIGNGVTISAGTVLSKSVPDNCLVSGNPGRIVQIEYDNSALINYRDAEEDPSVP
jgi:serine O-acetyltransferase